MASADLKFDEGHMWVRLEEDNAVVGLTDYAQDKLGEVIFVELPEEGAMVIRGDTCGTIESVKSVEDLLAPVSGEVVSVNDDVLDAPEAINEDSYGEGWLFEVRLEDN
ncbi:MAG TPA: glycine cleavage system protein GcvH, partial [Armatimonadota bacterium]|nr:glycine cleavage system protein GcvH [Armatimonadota bacterium]